MIIMMAVKETQAASAGVSSPPHVDIKTTSSERTSVSSANSWRKSIVNQLNHRNSMEQKPFEDIISFCTKLFESMEALRNEKLMLEKERAHHYLHSSSNHHQGTSGSASTPDSEARVFQLQDEVSDLKRTKGEYAQQIVDLRNSLEQKQKEIKTWRQKYEDADISLQEYKLMSQTLNSRILELQNQLQVVKDEHQALQIAFSSLESKSLARDKEYTALVERWISQRDADADRLNAENEMMIRRNQERTTAAIASAIHDMPNTQDPEKDTMACMADAVLIDPLSVISAVPDHMMLTFEPHEGEVNALKWLPTPESGITKGMVATGGGDRKVKIWEVTYSSVLLKATLTGSNAAITSIDMDNDLLLASSNDFASRVWSTDGKLRRTLTGHSNKVLAVKFMSSANRVVSGSHDRTLKIWDLNRHACIRTLFAGSSCNDVVVTSGGQESSSIISGHFDKRIRFWETRSEATCHEILLEGRITSLSISPNNCHLLSCSRDDTLKQLDLRMNQVVRTFCAENFKVGCDWSRASFSPDGEWVACGSQDGSVFIWNLNSGRVEKVLKNDPHHGSTVITCGWNPTGKIFMSCDKNKRAVVWSD